MTVITVNADAHKIGDNRELSETVGGRVRKECEFSLLGYPIIMNDQISLGELTNVYYIN